MCQQCFVKFFMMNGFSALKFSVRKISDFPHIAQQGQYVVMSWSASLSPRMLPRVCGARVGSLAHDMQASRHIPPLITKKEKSDSGRYN